MSRGKSTLIVIGILFSVYSAFQSEITYSDEAYKISTMNITLMQAPLVIFDPYMSVLDIDNRFRYNITNLQPMISVVAKHFKRIFILLKEDDLKNDKNTSLFLTPLSIAQYNREHPHAQLEVWLGREVSESLVNSKGQSSHSQTTLQILADQANEIFNDTVTTILLPYNPIDIHLGLATNAVNSSSRQYYRGLILEEPTCSFDTSLQSLNELEVDIVLLKMSPIVKSLSKSELVSKFESTLNDCQKHLTGNKAVTIGFRVSVPDTRDEEKVDMTHLVTRWHDIKVWSEMQSVPVVFSKAFDTPYENTVKQKTSGWWRLSEKGTESTDPANYVIQEKRLIAQQFDEEENMITLSWLEQPSQFSREQVGIIFSLHDSTKTQVLKYPEAKLRPLLSVLPNQFSKAVVILDDDTNLRSLSALSEVQALSKLNAKMEVFLIIMPHVSVARYFSLSAEELKQRYGIPRDLISVYVLPFTGKETAQIANSVKMKVDPNVALGYVFPISVCSAYTIMTREDKDALDMSMSDNRFKTAVFYFEQDIETVKLGAKRMFNQRLISFKSCRELLKSYGDGVSGMRLIFMLRHYATGREFYKSPRSLRIFVRFMEMLSEWAETTNTTVFLSSAIDGTRIFKQRSGERREVVEVGWWRHQQNATEWVLFDKKTDALQVTREHIQETTITDSSTLVIVIVVVPLVICIIACAVTIFIVRKYYQESLLTKAEIDGFFHGTVSSDEHTYELTEDGINNAVYALAYDKAQYEVARQKFSIDDDGALGAGEFGKVCRGKVETGQGTVNVAIKMMKAEKVHKTALSGLLSEIKVLAYIGKHPNIIELLGANTTNLKQGKIFVFLELCQLGSLETYLRKIRPVVHDDVDYKPQEPQLMAPVGGGNKYVNMGETTFEMGNRYVNIMRKPVLDSLLSQDMYRWSMEVCSAMAYLATKHVVHADLAARNVLLNLNKEAKICDFGLSRRMYNYTNYVKQQQEPLPWKWMPPEALRVLEFSEKSDVWAYGVVLWEIYSLGDSPYPGLSWDVNFPFVLERGMRMGEPKYNEREMYSMMIACWNVNPERRPSFVDLMKRFNRKNLR